ncbi:hypothetical protein EIN_375350 [Entamoeba invadens IP1]|uniref:RING-type E3 ubiquitin transferase n=1 Tax=Entamoeba invadens IP1 TaxID=370355 RepID=A0A0A1TU53_ENTIV|nr:hypothetical protein EIN_375350 [Entamoeba invadens IP1]ELP83440.1 hypothetical protein EIN_375350 [Entamoeba invadens IP1]|eukprot:XP_004182786.1 hypothetical protein EIN_375350 [Entamoeba invadens IP1]
MGKLFLMTFFLFFCVSSSKEQVTAIQKLTPLEELTKNNEVTFPLAGEWKSHTHFSFLQQKSGMLRVYSPRVLNNTDNVTIFECHIQMTDGNFGQDEVVDFTSFFYASVNQNMTFVNFDGFLASKLLTQIPVRVLRRSAMFFNMTHLEHLPKIFVQLPNTLTENFTLTGNVTIDGKLLEFTLHALNKQKLEGLALPYLGLVLALALIQSFSLVSQMDLTKTESSLKRSSYNTIVLMATSDAFICHIHVYLASLFTTGSVAFRLSILLSFLFFMIFSVFDVKFIFNIWKSQYGSVSQRSAMLLYLRLYATLFVLFILSVFSIHYFLFVCFSLWIPQIYQNFVSNNSSVVTVRYMASTTLPRFALVLYWFAFPYNFMNYRVDATLIGYLLLIVLLQIVMVVAQKRFGARCILPKFIHRFLVSEDYNYHRGWSDIVKMRGDLECLICMMNIDNTHMEEGCAEIVVTPCDHVFHTECLSSWNDYKMDCPTCRRPLDGVF